MTGRPEVPVSTPTVLGPPREELSPGQILGKCRVEQEIGRGGMGAVYRGIHTTLDIPVAIKVLPPHIDRQHKEFSARFMREAQLAAKLKHPNIMAVMDAGRDEATGLCYIVLEWVDGGSLEELILGGPLYPPRAVEIIRDAAVALAAAAKVGIVHRDIKPANIMLTGEGKVKVADLGLAKEMNEGGAGLTSTGIAMGTPAYMSPEQANSARDADIRSDIYSLGATLYHLLTGALPYNGETTINILTKVISDPVPDPRDLQLELPARLAETCMKMMAKEPFDRYQTPEDVIDALNDTRPGAPATPVAATVPQSTPPSPMPESSPKQPSRPRRRWTRYLLPLVILCLVLVRQREKLIEIWTLTKERIVEGQGEEPSLQSEDGRARLTRVDYQQVGGFLNGRARVMGRTDEGIRYGFIGNDKKIAIPLEFLEADEFSEGLAAVRVHQGWGYINPEGKFVTPPRFEEAGPFQSGRAEVKENGRSRFIPHPATARGPKGPMRPSPMNRPRVNIPRR
jgi:serine/threonine protein kinase